MQKSAEDEDFVLIQGVEVRVGDKVEVVSCHQYCPFSFGDVLEVADLCTTGLEVKLKGESFWWDARHFKAHSVVPAPRWRECIWPTGNLSAADFEMEVVIENGTVSLKEKGLKADGCRLLADMLNRAADLMEGKS